MSRLDDLIAQYCPDGVEYKQLEEVLKIKNGSDYKHLAVGSIPVYGSGGIIAYVDTPVYDKPSILIPRKGSIDKLYFVETPFWNVDTIFYTEIFTDIAIPRFIYYFLQREHLEKYNTAGGVPSLTQKVLNQIKIPVPPLPVQQEIVRILDTYTELYTNLLQTLTSELELSEKIYKYYRDKILTPTNLSSDSWYSLPEISENYDALRRPITSNQRVSGDIPYYGASGVVDFVKDYILDGDYLLISEDGANLLARSTPIAFSIKGKAWVNNHAHIIKFREKATQKYVEYYFNSIDLTPYITGGAQPKLNQKNLNSIRIPIPTLEEQKHIADLLDRNHHYYLSLSTRLTEEISRRHEQYNYYRDKLLSFSEKK